MFANLLKTAIRNIYKRLGYSLLNIIGLTLGISSAILLIIYISDELSYDNYNKNADRIYRVESKITEPDDSFTWIIAQVPFGPQVQQDYPDIEAYTRFINFQRALFTYNEKEFFEENVYYADTTVFDIFSYEFQIGTPTHALSRPNDMVLTESFARRYFGDENPVGKVLKSGDQIYDITGVLKDIPKNSHFRFDALVSRKSLPEEFGSWGNFGVFTYLMLKENTDVVSFEEKLQGMYSKFMAPIFERMGISIVYHLVPIKKIHLYSDNSGEPEPTGSIMYVIIFGMVALFLILIAIMNYINLATARSARRAKEVGLRKVAGAHRGMLIRQFLIESTTLTIISVILAVVVVALLMPSFNNVSGKSFELNAIFSPLILLSILGIVLLVGILGGSYPAFFLSRFSPTAVLKGDRIKGKSGSLFRKILVVVQFTLSAGMILCTLVVYKQLHYLQNMDRGWDMEEVVALQLPNGERPSQMTILKEKMLGNNVIEKIGSTNTQIGEGSGKVIFSMETDEGMDERGINFVVVDHDFIKTMGIEMVDGRNFSVDYMTDTLSSVIVNETLAKRMNWDDPIGKKCVLGDGSQIQAKVIGVMKDYHQTGMYNQVESLMLLYRLNNPILYVRVAPGKDAEALAFMENTWKEVFPNHPFESEYLTDRFTEQFQGDRKRGLIFTSFTILALIIACLGLFGLASYTVERRTREIGIRKVYGATESRIIGLVSKEFMFLIIISLAIALPLAWYLMNGWLTNYVYRMTITWDVFVIPALISVALTALTISVQAYRAAVANPTDSIKID